MKPITTAKIEPRLARHDQRTRHHRLFPATDHFFRPLADVTPGHARRRLSERSRRAFRRMTVEMLARHERDEPQEIALFAVVTAIVAWPLVSLLIVLAQTANG